jgi:hypothetical protein
LRSLKMEPKTRRSRPHTSSPPTIRLERLGARRNGRDEPHAASTVREAFPVRNVTVAAEPVAPAIRATAEPASRMAGDEPRPSPMQQAYDRLAARTCEVQALIGRIERFRYGRLIGRLARVVDEHIPKRSTVAVISRGDETLVTMADRRGWHFPQTSGGVYAGHHPADSRAAIAHLEQLRARGARYLLIPQTAFWWLDHYRELADHLGRTATCVYRDEQTCALFALAAGRTRK